MKYNKKEQTNTDPVLTWMMNLQNTTVSEESQTQMGKVIGFHLYAALEGGKL